MPANNEASYLPSPCDYDWYQKFKNGEYPDDQECTIEVCKSVSFKPYYSTNIQQFLVAETLITNVKCTETSNYSNQDARIQANVPYVSENIPVHTLTSMTAIDEIDYQNITIPIPTLTFTFKPSNVSMYTGIDVLERLRDKLSFSVVRLNKGFVNSLSNVFDEDGEVIVTYDDYDHDTMCLGNFIVTKTEINYNTFEITCLCEHVAFHLLNQRDFNASAKNFPRPFYSEANMNITQIHRGTVSGTNERWAFAAARRWLTALPANNILEVKNSHNSTGSRLFPCDRTYTWGNNKIIWYGQFDNSAYGLSTYFSSLFGVNGGLKYEDEPRYDVVDNPVAYASDYSPQYNAESKTYQISGMYSTKTTDTLQQSLVSYTLANWGHILPLEYKQNWKPSFGLLPSDASRNMTPNGAWELTFGQAVSPYPFFNSQANDAFNIGNMSIYNAKFNATYNINYNMIYQNSLQVENNVHEKYSHIESTSYLPSLYTQYANKEYANEHVVELTNRPFNLRSDEVVTGDPNITAVKRNDTWTMNHYVNLPSENVYNPFEVSFWSNRTETSEEQEISCVKTSSLYSKWAASEFRFGRSLKSNSEYNLSNSLLVENTLGIPKVIYATSFQRPSGISGDLSARVPIVDKQFFITPLSTLPEGGGSLKFLSEPVDENATDIKILRNTGIENAVLMADEVQPETVSSLDRVNCEFGLIYGHGKAPLAKISWAMIDDPSLRVGTAVKLALQNRYVWVYVTKQTRIFDGSSKLECEGYITEYTTERVHSVGNITALTYYDDITYTCDVELEASFTGWSENELKTADFTMYYADETFHPPFDPIPFLNYHMESYENTSFLTWAGEQDLKPILSPTIGNPPDKWFPPNVPTTFVRYKWLNEVEDTTLAWAYALTPKPTLGNSEYTLQYFYVSELLDSLVVRESDGGAMVRAVEWYDETRVDTIFDVFVNDKNIFNERVFLQDSWVDIPALVKEFTHDFTGNFASSKYSLRMKYHNQYKERDDDHTSEYVLENKIPLKVDVKSDGIAYNDGTDTLTIHSILGFENVWIDDFYVKNVQPTHIKIDFVYKDSNGTELYRLNLGDKNVSEIFYDHTTTPLKLRNFSNKIGRSPDITSDTIEYEVVVTPDKKLTSVIHNRHLLGSDIQQTTPYVAPVNFSYVEHDLLDSVSQIQIKGVAFNWDGEETRECTLEIKYETNNGYEVIDTMTYPAGTTEYEYDELFYNPTWANIDSLVFVFSYTGVSYAPIQTLPKVNTPTILEIKAATGMPPTYQEHFSNQSDKIDELNYYLNVELRATNYISTPNTINVTIDTQIMEPTSSGAEIRTSVRELSRDYATDGDNIVINEPFLSHTIEYYNEVGQLLGNFAYFRFIVTVTDSITGWQKIYVVYPDSMNEIIFLTRDKHTALYSGEVNAGTEILPLTNGHWLRG